MLITRMIMVEPLMAPPNGRGTRDLSSGVTLTVASMLVPNFIYSLKFPIVSCDAVKLISYISFLLHFNLP